MALVFTSARAFTRRALIRRQWFWSQKTRDRRGKFALQKSKAFVKRHSLQCHHQSAKSDCLSVLFGLFFAGSHGAFELMKKCWIYPLSNLKHNCIFKLIDLELAISWAKSSHPCCCCCCLSLPEFANSPMAMNVCPISSALRKLCEIQLCLVLLVPYPPVKLAHLEPQTLVAGLLELSCCCCRMATITITTTLVKRRENCTLLQTMPTAW